MITKNMKPKSKKEAKLMENFANVCDENPDLTDKEKRKIRKMWKRQRTKLLRKDKNFLEE